MIEYIKLILELFGIVFIAFIIESLIKVSKTSVFDRKCCICGDDMLVSKHRRLKLINGLRVYFCKSCKNNHEIFKEVN